MLYRGFIRVINTNISFDKMSVNCLCLIKQTEDPSWITVTRLRMENNRGQPRNDKIRVYLPFIVGIATARFVHELNENDKNYGKENSTYKNIEYHGMNSECEYDEARAIVDVRSWAIWNENETRFTKPIDYKNYMFIKFSRIYWDDLN